MNAWDTAEIPPAWNGQPLSHEDMLERINRLTAQYEFLHVTRLCETPDGQIIPLLVLGSGEKSVLYFGEDEGWCGLLLRFAEEYCAAYRRAGVLYGCSLPYLYKNRLLYVVPFLPSDQNGEEARNILENTLRTEDRLRGLVGVSSGGRYLACLPDRSIRQQSVFRCVSAATGLTTVKEPTGLIAHAILRCGKPSVGISTAECSGKGFFPAYFSVREVLFRLPLVLT